MKTGSKKQLHYQFVVNKFAFCASVLSSTKDNQFSSVACNVARFATGAQRSGSAHPPKDWILGGPISFGNKIAPQKILRGPHQIKNSANNLVVQIVSVCSRQVDCWTRGLLAVILQAGGTLVDEKESVLFDVAQPAF